MKLKIKIKLLCFILLIMPLNIVFASGESINISCPSKVNAGSTITCQVTGHSDGKVSSLSAKLSTSNQIETANFITASIWQGNGSNGNIQLYTDTNKTGDFSIGTITIKISSNAISTTAENVLLHNILFYDDNFNEINVANKSSNIKITSTNNYLSNLSINNGVLSPNFNGNTTSYTATVDTDNITINATASDPSASISGTGKKELKVGLNNFTVTVISESGSKREYKLAITREQKGNQNTTTTTKSSSSSAKNNMNPNTTGKELSDNTYLKKLEIEGYEIAFDKTKTEYEITVPSEVTNVKVTAEPEDKNAKIIIDGNKSLNYGKNVVVVDVISESNIKEQYKIIVTREIDDRFLLKELSIEDYKIDFNSKTFIYNIKIADTKSLNILTESIDENANIEIIGNEELKDGSVITVRLTLDNETVDYKINVSKIEDSPKAINKKNIKDIFKKIDIIHIALAISIITNIILIISILPHKNKKAAITDNQNEINSNIIASVPVEDTPSAVTSTPAPNVNNTVVSAPVQDTPSVVTSTPAPNVNNTVVSAPVQDIPSVVTSTPAPNTSNTVVSAPVQDTPSVVTSTPAPNTSNTVASAPVLDTPSTVTSTPASNASNTIASAPVQDTPSAVTSTPVPNTSNNNNIFNN